VRVIDDVEQIDGLLARALNSRSTWQDGIEDRELLPAIDYHGVAALLNERRDGIEDWPETVRTALQERALAQAMWELRHRVVLADLLRRFASRGIAALLLKGSALAYDLYGSPSDRARGDSDVLVAERSLQAAREALSDAGFQRQVEGGELPQELRAQESWAVLSGGSNHVVDLHWHVLNAPALYGHFTFEELWQTRRKVSKLDDAAFVPAREILLAHACVHRAFHQCSPYFVGERTYFGGDRLIWLLDLALLGRSLSRRDWARFVSFATARGLGPISLEGLVSSEARFGPFCLPEVKRELGKAGSNSYLASGQLGRAVMDWWAVRGPQRKAQYALAKLLPSRQFMQAKYPSERDKPLPLLYLRRVRELIRPRRTGANAG